ncbi:Dyp-type peroxidase [Nocardia cyriacigeorgica]|uniref:Dyp-type peroxidase n=1 Tax=Nocardia cyriacigeorgica TaxID=135487 RepID=UPI0013D84647|nr:Dyp-type peroxidase [Nocardia cyriacigeorgica]MBF6437049.1 Dyp-type peroxidase [Nocardia cyriacigeorgica]MBF6452618.1 Dyp-type peroxidase [Nocardia cyriacigeorgica]MBF6479674.1 Dyp-type peroxidase [Nocardia cyriacigeorgica]MBF6549787.1 Dyp-type peroxidase [Nocardia cyriacigeorgica]NEW26135.1 Dyp-type peroxidase [Nocardia cyriacigeorgica]
MGEPQPILQPLTPSAIFLVATIDEGGEATVRDLLADLAGLRRSVGFRLPGADLTCIVGIGSAAWDRLFSGPRPAELHEFPGYDGPRHQAPATPGDLLFHIKAEVHDACFELAMAIGKRLDGAATIVDEVTGFRYFEQRDLLGFVDGTENPEGALAESPAGRVALIGDEDPDFTCGSYVIVQKYVHKMSEWAATSVEEQERVIGRTKLDDFELPDEVKPANSHVAVNTIVDPDGTERQILRANMPFGSIRDNEMGTYFVGYSATPSVTERMLERMFLGSDEAAYDRILDFSIAVTGSLFFVPAQDFLDDLPDPPGDAPADDATPAAPAADGSLGIGTLKRSS